MATKRMFSKDVIDRDQFYDLPFTSQLLYFHLGLHADVKGFVEPKKIVRIVGLKIEDIKPLVENGFVILFESGVVVITDWNVHNNVRENYESQTQFPKELDQLLLTEQGNYELQGNYSSNAVELRDRLDKIRLDKVRSDKERENTSAIKEIKYSSIKEITQDVLQEISLRYDVPPDFVADCWDSALNWLEAKGTTKKNYKSFLANWVKREKVNLVVKKTRGGYVDGRGL